MRIDQRHADVMRAERRYDPRRERAMARCHHLTAEIEALRVAEYAGFARILCVFRLELLTLLLGEHRGFRPED